MKVYLPPSRFFDCQLRTYLKVNIILTSIFSSVFLSCGNSQNISQHNKSQRDSSEVVEHKILSKSERNRRNKHNSMSAESGSNPNNKDTHKHELDGANILHKKINHKQFELELYSNFYKEFPVKDRELPLRVSEVYPGIVTYDKYDSIKVVTHSHNSDSNDHPEWAYTRVIDKIEFYEKNKLFNSYELDSNNPYLFPRYDIMVLNHWSDAESTDILHNKTKGSNPITSFHLRQNIVHVGPYTCINYWKNEISNHRIVSTFTTIRVLDSTGNVIFNKEIPGLVGPPAIDPNGEFLMASIVQEETTNTSGYKYKSDGFVLWSVKLDKLLHTQFSNAENFLIGNPNFSSHLNQLGVSWSHNRSNSKSFRENRNNILDIVYYYSIENNTLYRYNVTIGFTIEDEEYVRLHKRNRSWSEISNLLNIEPVSLNYGKI